MEVYPRLLRRTPLLPGESLPSLLARLSLLNGYEGLGNINWLAGEDWYSRRKEVTSGVAGRDGRVMDAPSRPERPATYERLAALTGLVPIALYRASAHALNLPTAKEPEYIHLSADGRVHSLPLLPTNLRGALRDTSSAWYCPMCLQGEPYHKLVWLSKACVACLEHKLLLVSGCPACQAKVSVLDIVKARCGQCDSSLADAPSVDISGDALGMLSQHVIQAGLAGEAIPDGLRLANGLPNESPAVLHHFMHGLTINIARKIQKLGKPWTYLHSINGASITNIARTVNQVEDPQQLYALYATAAKPLLQWPVGFHTFLDAYRTAESKPRADSSLIVISDLGALYTTWIKMQWQKPEFGFVQEAFDQYLLERQAQLPRLTHIARYENDPKFASNVEHVPLDIAAELLKLPRHTVTTLAHDGWLKSSGVRTHPKRSHLLIDRDHLRVVAERWKDTVPPATAARLLGVHESTLIQLVNTGFLKAASGPGVDGCPVWMFHKDDVEQCFQRVMRRAIAVDSTSECMVDIDKIVRKLLPVYGSIVGVKAALLQKVADGSLPAYVVSARPGVKRFDSMLFVAGDVDKLRPSRRRGRARIVSC